MNVKDVIKTIPKEIEEKVIINLKNIPEEGYDCKGRYYKKIPLGKAENITQKNYTYLTPLFRVNYNNSILTYWLCLCKCGNLTISQLKSIKNGSTKSCGCYNSKQTKERQTSDLINKKFFYLTVLSPTEERKHGQIVWKCLCDCGKIHYVKTIDLKKGYVKSCGCMTSAMKSLSSMDDITNQKFGLLTALSPEKTTSRGWSWKCKCECGAEVIVCSRDLKTEKTLSCGCLKSKGEYIIAKILNENNIPFIKQKTFKDCFRIKVNGKLHYDFYINNSFLLEFDGEQHYKSINFFNGEEGFKDLQEKDSFKNNYAKEHNIPLKRIPYWALKELTIEDIMGDKYLIN